MKNEENINALDDIKSCFEENYEASLYVIQDCVDNFKILSFLCLYRRFTNTKKKN